MKKKNQLELSPRLKETVSEADNISIMLARREISKSAVVLADMHKGIFPQSGGLRLQPGVSRHMVSPYSVVLIHSKESTPEAIKRKTNALADSFYKALVDKDSGANLKETFFVEQRIENFPYGSISLNCVWKPIVKKAKLVGGRINVWASNTFGPGDDLCFTAKISLDDPLSRILNSVNLLCRALAVDICREVASDAFVSGKSRLEAPDREDNSDG